MAGTTKEMPTGRHTRIVASVAATVAATCDDGNAAAI